jgi:hypothetical protein
MKTVLKSNFSVEHAFQQCVWKKKNDVHDESGQPIMLFKNQFINGLDASSFPYQASEILGDKGFRILM